MKGFCMAEIYSTSDLWLGALFLTETDAQLVDVKFTRNGRETVFFTFRGKDLSRFAQAYCQDQALANVSKLRVKMNDLRDLIFNHRQIA